MSARLTPPSSKAARVPQDRAKATERWYDPDAAGFTDGAGRSSAGPAAEVVDPAPILAALPAAALVAGIDGRILVSNERADRLFGGSLAGRTIDDLVPESRRPLRTLLRRAFSRGDDFSSGGAQAALLARRRDGTSFRINLSLNRIQTAGGTAILAVVVDTTAAPTSVDELAREALTDSLTGLGNRAALLAALSRQFSRPVAEHPLTVLTIDLDGLRETNRRHGRPAGDDLLRRYAARLAATVRTGDLVARTGGDEFVVLCDGPLAAGRAIAARLIGSAVERRANPSSGLGLTASIGLAARCGRERSSTLLRRADAAVQAARAAGPHQVVDAG